MVTQYHFTSWPDHGVPRFPAYLIAFIYRVRRAYNKDDGYPLLVHCSAGVGRTGSFILLDSMLERMKVEDTVNVYEFLHSMRAQRFMMVQTLVSYNICKQPCEVCIASSPGVPHLQFLSDQNWRCGRPGNEARVCMY